MVTYTYDESISSCWEDYQRTMDPIKEDWCDWAVISRWGPCPRVVWAGGGVCPLWVGLEKIRGHRPLWAQTLLTLVLSAPSPYSDLQECLERGAEDFDLGFPNPWAEQVIFKTHQTHFANCTPEQTTFSDPPEDVLLAMIITPICLIPFLVTLVVWKSKDSEART